MLFFLCAILANSGLRRSAVRAAEGPPRTTMSLIVLSIDSMTEQKSPLVALLTAAAESSNDDEVRRFLRSLTHEIPLVWIERLPREGDLTEPFPGR